MNKVTLTTVVVSLVIISVLAFFLARTKAAKDNLANEQGVIVKGYEDQLAKAAAEHSRRETALQAQINQLEAEREAIMAELEENEELTSRIRDSIAGIAADVARQNKLAALDEELLLLYSQTYFLNEHYVPSSLSPIDQIYLANSERSLFFHTNAWPFLEDLLVDAKNEGLDLRVASAYRSFGTQAELKSAYLIQYGSGANQFSADQGYSEHQLGTTVDFTSSSNDYLLEGFATTPEFAWLEDHAHEYGFVLSYPEHNDYYQYEPWHWRFVGTELAEELDESHKYLYELEQRELNEYLLNIFD